MSILPQGQKPQRVCFVTVGATASFDSLISVALSPPFLEALKTYGYTHLRLQHGKDGGKVLEEFRRNNDATSQQIQGLCISGFDFNKQGLGWEMRAAKGEGKGIEGVVISHAGTIYLFTIHEAPGLRIVQDQALSLTLYESQSPLSLYPIQTCWTIIRKSWQKSSRYKAM